MTFRLYKSGLRDIGVFAEEINFRRFRGDAAEESQFKVCEIEKRCLKFPNSRL